MSRRTLILLVTVSAYTLLTGGAAFGQGIPVVYDLSTDWSDTSNPNGPWSYNAGDHAIATHWSAWATHFFTHAQPAWARAATGSGHVPAWMRAVAGIDSYFSAAEVGDVVVHAHDTNAGLPDDDPANVTWTSPISYGGNATIEGAVWRVWPGLGRATDWSLYVAGQVVASGSLGPGDGGGRPTEPSDPRTFSIAAPISAGDVVKIEFRRTSVYGDVNGVRLTISCVLSNQPAEITCNGPVVLWSPNHELVDVSSAFSVSDPDEGDTVTLSIRVLSDESEVPETGDGTGRHAPDFKDEQGGRGLLVRSERRGGEDGRFYVAVITADDGTTTTTTVCTLAVCPHDQDNPASLDDVLAQAALAVSEVELVAEDLAAGAAGEPLPATINHLWEHGLSDPLGPHQ